MIFYPQSLSVRLRAGFDSTILVKILGPSGKTISDLTGWKFYAVTKRSASHDIDDDETFESAVTQVGNNLEIKTQAIQTLDLRNGRMEMCVYATNETDEDQREFVCMISLYIENHGRY